MKKQGLKGVLLFVVLITVCLFALENVQAADEFPTKGVTMVLSSIGGFHDLTTRPITAVIEKYLGQSLLFMHKPGAGGGVAADLVARSAPDGYTILCSSGSTLTVQPAIMGRGKAPEEEFVSICRLSYAPLFLWTRLDRPWKDTKGLIEWAKAHPDQLKVATQGAWSPGDAPWRMFMKETGITSRVAFYDGGGETLLALLGGHVDVAPGMYAHSGPSYKAGKIGCLAIFDDKRFPDMSEIATAREQGINVVHTNYVVLMAPKGTPRPIIDKLATAFKKATEDPEAIKMYSKMGEDYDYLGPDEFTKLWKEEYATMKELSKIFKDVK